MFFIIYFNINQKIKIPHSFSPATTSHHSEGRAEQSCKLSDVLWSFSSPSWNKMSVSHTFSFHLIFCYFLRVLHSPSLSKFRSFRNGKSNEVAWLSDNWFLDRLLSAGNSVRYELLQEKLTVDWLCDNHASYYESPGFKFWAEHRLFWQQHLIMFKVIRLNISQ
jgi:hypothetical protein